MATVYCPKCQALAVNGQATHEHGCPLTRNKWIFRGRGDYRYCLPEGVEAPSRKKDYPQQTKPISRGITGV